MPISISEIDQLLNLKTTSELQRKPIEILLSANNDWPNSVTTFEEYEQEVRVFVGGPTTIENIKQGLKRISLDTDAWRAESLAELIEVYKLYDGDLRLQDIVQKLSTGIPSD